MRAGLLPADAAPLQPSDVTVGEDDVAAAVVAGGGVGVARVGGLRVAGAVHRVLREADPVDAERRVSVPGTAGEGTAFEADRRAAGDVGDPVGLRRRADFADPQACSAGTLPGVDAAV